MEEMIQYGGGTGSRRTVLPTSAFSRTLHVQTRKSSLVQGFTNATPWASWRAPWGRLGGKAAGSSLPQESILPRGLSSRLQVFCGSHRVKIPFRDDAQRSQVTSPPPREVSGQGWCLANHASPQPGLKYGFRCTPWE